jgi:hypothetical protein
LSKISGIASKEFCEYFRKVDIVAPFSISISDVLMSPCKGSEYVRDDNDYSISASYVIEGNSVKVKDLAFWLILSF